MADRVFPAPAALLRRDRTGPETSERSAFQFLDPLAGRLCGIAGPSLIAPEGPPSPQTFFPGRSPNWPVRCDGHRPSLQLESAVPRPSPSFHCCALRPSLHWGFRRSTTLLDHCIPARSGSPPARAASAPASTRTDRMPLEGRVPSSVASRSGGQPPQSMRCRDCERRLRIRAAFGVRPLAGAVEECYRACRPIPQP